MDNKGIKILSKSEYEAQIAATRDRRMSWWRDARFGMFVHYGLYSIRGMQEWSMVRENTPIEEYEKLANQFCPKEGAPREWAALAKAAGMKYMVFTTRHHEGFSLWDSKVNPYNSVNYGPHRDIVREYVDACREFGLGVGFYSSVMDWHHPDGWTCMNDRDSRKRFLDYLYELNVELLTNYGKIDILWYDMSYPMRTWEGWNAVEFNQKLRAIQPDIIINNRLKLEEDFGTPEESIVAGGKDWEACMTFNGMSWGYIDSAQALAYSYTPQQIVRMLYRTVNGGGNLLLNIGPTPDASIPKEVTEPLTKVGKWLEANGEAVYGKGRGRIELNGVTEGSVRGNTVYAWNWIWPSTGEMAFGGIFTKCKRITYLATGEDIEFEQRTGRILLKNLPTTPPDKTLGITMLKLEFDEAPTAKMGSYYPQLSQGHEMVTVRD